MLCVCTQCQHGVSSTVSSRHFVQLDILFPFGSSLSFHNQLSWKADGVSPCFKDHFLLFIKAYGADSFIIIISVWHLDFWVSVFFPARPFISRTPPRHCLIAGFHFYFYFFPFTSPFLFCFAFKYVYIFKTWLYDYLLNRLSYSSWSASWLTDRAAGSAPASLHALCFLIQLKRWGVGREKITLSGIL